MGTRRALAVSAAVLFVGCGGCGRARDAARPVLAPPGPRAVLDGPGARHGVLLSLDGLGGGALERALAERRLPGFERLRREGACTWNARTDPDNTTTLPNHTAMLTGRAVVPGPGAAPARAHGYVENQRPDSEETVHGQVTGGTGYVPSILDVAHDRGYGTALYASKQKFELFDQSYGPVHGAPDRTAPDDGRDKVDVVRLDPDSAGLVAAFQADLARLRFVVALLHLRDLDSVGHGDGWEGPAWQAALDRVDGLLASLLDGFARDPVLGGHVALVVTADHGGEGDDHRDPSKLTNQRIPLCLWGPGVPAGVDAYAVVVGRRDPGERLPPHGDAPPPLRNGDAGNLVLRLVGLPTVPGSLTGDVALRGE